jgi:hypothetical protein
MPRPFVAIRRQAHLRRNKDESIANARTRGPQHFASIHYYHAAELRIFFRLPTLPNSGLSTVAPDGSAFRDVKLSEEVAPKPV